MAPSHLSDRPLGRGRRVIVTLEELSQGGWAPNTRPQLRELRTSVWCPQLVGRPLHVTFYGPQTCDS